MSNMRIVLDAMADHFDNWGLSEVPLYYFLQLSQAEGEHVLEWATRISRLAYQAFPTFPKNEVERQIVSRFTIGLLDKEASRYIQCQQPVSLTSAIQSPLPLIVPSRFFCK